ncbi:LutC/YkgG family protein [Cryptosporangium aurantiacum]|uniref:L-lactate dehydrogenase complex protein LldG n=1 Tax=Cryptosporangium aurantiacum TaxID=134849 RepID=A0A1M7R8Y0_9ACTN|nr:LUD domain-containing protein [Cryptosporangium aurantiacum]SHN42632.1 L-lactate dehydrogenase complex protein LldG [Cryptosporangium aurantiacum]
MTSAKDEIFARLRAAVAEHPGRGAGGLPRDYRGAGGVDGPVDLDLLVERLEDYKATVRRTTSAGLAATVAAALRDRGVRRLVAPAGLPEEWLGAVDGVEFVADSADLGPHDLDTVDGVITSSAVTIVATGTIVLDAGPGQGRRALSLVPDYHLCVVLGDTVVDGVPAAVARLDATRPQTWISGPSATSDIELNRVEGVHGPRTLEVIVVA